MDICVSSITAVSDTLINLFSLHSNLHVDGCSGIQVIIWFVIMIQRADTNRALEMENGLIHTQAISWSRVVIYS